MQLLNATKLKEPVPNKSTSHKRVVTVHWTSEEGMEVGRERKDPRQLVTTGRKKPLPCSENEATEQNLRHYLKVTLLILNESFTTGYPILSFSGAAQLHSGSPFV
ncbi:hypothetical protein Ddc_16504 [Ditylenchus destructor]|nr:hypothetical protein Ddc_16504 [Ditylenchus destructor]